MMINAHRTRDVLGVSAISLSKQGNDIVPQAGILRNDALRGENSPRTFDESRDLR